MRGKYNPEVREASSPNDADSPALLNDLRDRAQMWELYALRAERRRSRACVATTLWDRARKARAEAAAMQLRLDAAPAASCARPAMNAKLRDAALYCKTLDLLPKEDAVNALHQALMQFNAIERGVENVDNRPIVVEITRLLKLAGHLGFTP